MRDRLSDASTQDVKALEEESESIWDRATRVLTTGLWSVSHGAFRYPDGVFPLLARRGEGCILWDTTGRPYVDWMIGWGPVILGYRHPAVEQAIRDQLAEGPLLSLLHPLEVEVAERLCDAVPCAERVAFGKNGSDVLAAAVRVARAFTGREIVLHHGYHGFHDWYLAAHPACEGIPEALRPLIHEFGYNDLEGLARLFDRFGDRIAAVVMEPTNIVLPAPGFLESVRQRTRENGSLLVFDEIITGFRWDLHGAQAVYGITPDLSTFGKAMSNGFSASALVGKREFMEAGGIYHNRERVFLLSLTYGAETHSLAAALATMRIYESEPVVEHLHRQGGRLAEGIRQIAAHNHLEEHLGVDGRACNLIYFTRDEEKKPSQPFRTLFLQEIIKRGIIAPSLVLSYSHSDADIDRTLDAIAAAAQIYARALDEGVDQYLVGRPVKPVMRPYC